MKSSNETIVEQDVDPRKYYPYLRITYRCVIPHCPSKYYRGRDETTDFKNIKFSTFPADKERRKQWIDIIKKETGLEIPYDPNSKGSRKICCKHFPKRFYSVASGILVRGYPTLFPLEMKESDLPDTREKGDCTKGNGIFENQETSKKILSEEQDGTQSSKPSKNLSTNSVEKASKSPEKLQQKPNESCDNSSKDLSNTQSTPNGILQLLSEELTQTSSRDEYFLLGVSNTLNADNLLTQDNSILSNFSKMKEFETHTFKTDKFIVLEIPDSVASSKAVVHSIKQLEEEPTKSSKFNYDYHPLLEHNYYKVPLVKCSNSLDNNLVCHPSTSIKPKRRCEDKFLKYRTLKEKKIQQKSDFLKKKIKLKLLKKKFGKICLWSTKDNFTKCLVQNRHHKITVLNKNDVFSLAKSATGNFLLGELRNCLIMPFGCDLKALLHNIPLDDGISSTTLSRLSAKMTVMKTRDRFCVVMFGTMSLTSKLEYCKESDKILGYTNRNKCELASQALVFMLHGLYRPWKQPVACYFVRDLTAQLLTDLLGEVVSTLQAAGVRVMATICNHSRVNRAALSKLCTKSTGDIRNDPYFIINNQKIFVVYDPSTLLMSTRDALLKYNIEFEPQKLANFDHIKELFRIDKARSFPGLWKIRENYLHIRKNTLLKSKVNVAAKTLSGTVASCMGPEGVCSAQFVCDVDLLFDSFNGNNDSIENGKVFRRSLSDRSRHWLLWKKMVPLIDRWVFHDKSTGEVRSNLPLKGGWITTIKATELLWKTCRTLGFKFLATKSLNLDPLQNFFAGIQYFGAKSKTPTVYEFTSAFKLSILNNLVLPCNAKSNCEKDQGFLLDNCRDLFLPSIEDCKFSNSDCGEIQDLHIPDFELETSDIRREYEIITEVGSFLLTRLKLSCELCKSNLVLESAPLCFSEHDGQIPFYLNKNFSLYISTVYHTSLYILNRFGYVCDIRRKLKLFLLKNVNFEWFNCVKHKRVFLSRLLNLCVFKIIKIKLNK